MRDRLSSFLASRWGIMLTGGTIGLISVLLYKAGNPPNMGICAACFERDIAGALGLHRAGVVQAMRPEIPGFVLGSLIAALTFGEFRAQAGSSAIVRFLLGAFAMIGALVFLGCPWRGLFRLGGGDLNAIVGLAGLAVGISIGVWFLRRGYSPGRPVPQPSASGWVLPGLMVALVVLAIAEPSFVFSSQKGPGAMRASLALALGAGLLVGFLGQRSRFCTVAAVRNCFTERSFAMLTGIGVLLAATFVANLIFGRVKFGFDGQPIAHSNHLWNALGMVLAGLAFTLSGGCPGRQLFRAGTGDGDAGLCVLGMIFGAAFAHNFGLAAAPDRLVDGAMVVGGPSGNGQVAVILGLVVCVALGVLLRGRGAERGG